MAEDLIIDAGADRASRYQQLIPQLRSLLEGEPDRVANLANAMAALKETFGWLWVGVYMVKDEQLVLGPFQGPVACTRIHFGKGVCGTAWKNAETIIVPDVDAFPGHIACSSLSRSEIVVPLLKDKEVIGVIDVDSIELNDFSDLDKNYLEQIATMLVQSFTDA